jgi:predicted  nucleic acid-binding Zn-ribbon protein
MTNLQLLLTIGIPAMLIVLSWINSSQRIDAVHDSLNKQIGSLDKRMNAFDSRLDSFERRMDSFEKRLEDARRDSHKDALEIMRSMTSLHERVAIVEAKQA